MPRNNVIMSNLKKPELLTEYKWIQESDDKVSLPDLDNRAKEKCQLEKTFYQTSSRITQNESKIQEETNDDKFKGEKARMVNFSELEELLI